MPQRPLHILLVEDNHVDAEFFVRGFQEGQVKQPITVVRDGIEALELLRGQTNQTRLEPPYLIFADLNLPRMNGIELLKELRRDPQLRHSTVFILTTSALEADMLAAYDQQIAGYLLKARVTADFSLLVRLVACYREIVEFPP